MNRVKKLRIKKGLSQNDLAVSAGVTPKYIGFIENGERTPSLPVANKIAIALNSTVDEIFLSKKCTKCTSRDEKD